MQEISLQWPDLWSLCLYRFIIWFMIFCTQLHCSFIICQWNLKIILNSSALLVRPSNPQASDYFFHSHLFAHPFIHAAEKFRHRFVAFVFRGLSSSCKYFLRYLIFTIAVSMHKMGEVLALRRWKLFHIAIKTANCHNSSLALVLVLLYTTARGCLSGGAAGDLCFHEDVLSMGLSLQARKK